MTDRRSKKDLDVVNQQTKSNWDKERQKTFSRAQKEWEYGVCLNGNMWKISQNLDHCSLRMSQQYAMVVEKANVIVGALIEV